jgi:leukotriene-A4 hydrolase
MKYNLILLFAVAALWGCDQPAERSEQTKERIAQMKLATDHHSYARPNEAKVTHLNWDAEVDFETRTIRGIATYNIEANRTAKNIYFDMRDLKIDSVSTDDAGLVSFSIGESRDFMGQPLEVPITGATKTVSIYYECPASAAALLWVEGEKPFLFTQSQAILARTWIPCQDSPGIRFTYHARVKVPVGLLALMSANNPTALSEDGIYEFDMEQPIPSYLMALAVGDIAYREIGPHTAVYATPDLIEKAAWEFAEMEDLLVAAESLYGKYVWERYDLLVLPAAFPFGGMENPRLTFATPTIIAGDRSLVALVAHELAHSWSGNLVTNSTWDDFWLNEGFTVYFEQRIMEAVYGREVSEMLAVLTYQGLEKEVSEIMDLNPNDTHLKLHLQGRDPDEGMTAIAYDKGYFFLRLLEETVGREKFDVFLNSYFSSNSFKVMDTEQFVDYLESNLLDSALVEKVNLDAWIYGPGLPDNCPTVHSSRLDSVEMNLNRFVAGEAAPSDIPWKDWVYQERYYFLDNLPDSIGYKNMVAMDKAFNITGTGNNEVLFVWLRNAISNNYTPAYARLENFLVNVGRRKFLTPLYAKMKETDQKELADAIYSKARQNYHSVAVVTIDELLGYSE